MRILIVTVIFISACSSIPKNGDAKPFSSNDDSFMAQELTYGLMILGRMFSSSVPTLP